MKCAYHANRFVQDSLRYEIVDSERARQYYYLSPDSGQLSLKALLTDSDHRDDQVSQFHVKHHSPKTTLKH